MLSFCKVLSNEFSLLRMKIDWNVGGESNGIILLRMLMRRLPVTAQDLWLAERFDQIDESKPRIRKTGLGAIMQGHFDKQNVTRLLTTCFTHLSCFLYFFTASNPPFLPMYVEDGSGFDGFTFRKLFCFETLHISRGSDNDCSKVQLCSKRN